MARGLHLKGKSTRGEGLYVQVVGFGNVTKRGISLNNFLWQVELLSLMSTADIRAIGADVLLTWGGRILTGLTHPQVCKGLGIWIGDVRALGTFTSVDIKVFLSIFA